MISYRHLKNLSLILCLGFPNDSIIVNPIQDGGGGGGRPHKKATRTRFSPVTSTNVPISPQNFLTLRFNPFATLV